MKILVRGTNWIGDAVMTVPALKELRRAFPNAAITLQARPAAAAVFEEAEFVDEILPIAGSKSKFANVISQSRQIRGRGFDVGVILTNSIEAAMVHRLGGIPRRFGYATQGRRAFLTDPLAVPDWKDKRHEVYFYLNLIESVGKKLDSGSPRRNVPPSTDISVSEQRIRTAREQLDILGAPAERPLIALGIGSTNSRAKRWPAERYSQLATRLALDTKATILLVGSEADKIVADAVKRSSRTDIIDLCGSTSIQEAAAILAFCDLLIANDMGLAHLAPAVGTQTIVIFGPTNEVTTRPFSDNAQVIRNPVECSPCMLRDCPIDHRCMTGVSVEMVFEQARAILSTK